MKTSKKRYVGNVRELKVYGKILELIRIVYEITESLPEFEQYNLGAVFRRSSTSMLANLSEGNTNYYYKKEYNHLNMVLGKIGECRSALDICKTVGYISDAIYLNADLKCEEILKMMIGMMRRIESYLESIQDTHNKTEMIDKSYIDPDTLAIVYEKATIFNNLISKVVLKLPRYEEEIMKDQMVRAAKSVLQNLTNSNSCSTSQLYLAFNTSLGSISESIAFCDVAVLQSYISNEQYDSLFTLGSEIKDSLINLMNQAVQINNEETEEVYCKPEFKKIAHLLARTSNSRIPLNFLGFTASLFPA